MLLRLLAVSQKVQAHERDEVQSLAFQRMCMHNLVGVGMRESLVDDLLRTQLIDAETDDTSVCAWKGVTCVDAVVTFIYWVGRYTAFYPTHTKSICPCWFPPSLRRATIRYEHFDGPLEICMLPRECLAVVFNQCGIRGNVDFRALPKKMQQVDLSLNQISGTIHLTALPRSLVSIRMQGNPVSKVYVLNSCFCDWFVSAHFEHPEGENGHRIKFVETTAKEVDERVKVTLFYTHYTVKEYRNI